MTVCLRCSNVNPTRVEFVMAVPNADPPIPARSRWYCGECQLTFYTVRNDEVVLDDGIRRCPACNKIRPETGGAFCNSNCEWVWNAAHRH